MKWHFSKAEKERKEQEENEESMKNLIKILCPHFGKQHEHHDRSLCTLCVTQISCVDETLHKLDEEIRMMLKDLAKKIATSVTSTETNQKEAGK